MYILVIAICAVICGADSWEDALKLAAWMYNLLMNMGSDQRFVKIDNPAVQAALQDLQSELKRLFKKNAPAIVLFGSYARGQASPESDVDVLLLYSYDIHPSAEIRRVSGILAKLNLRYQVLISVLPATEQNYLYSQEPFWNNVRREGVPITTL
jgi:predicted nucleotidyltransferase